MPGVLGSAHCRQCLSRVPGANIFAVLPLGRGNYASRNFENPPIRQPRNHSLSESESFRPCSMTGPDVKFVLHKEAAVNERCRPTPVLCNATLGYSDMKECDSREMGLKRLERHTFGITKNTLDLIEISPVTVSDIDSIQEVANVAAVSVTGPQPTIRMNRSETTRYYQRQTPMMDHAWDSFPED
jgi:hypothetical protein